MHQVLLVENKTYDGALEMARHSLELGKKNKIIEKKKNVYNTDFFVSFLKYQLKQCKK